MTQSPLDALTEINLDDLATAFGVQHRPWLNRAVRRIFYGTARKFAKQVVDFDSAIASRGLVEAARMTDRFYVRDVRVFGADRLPSSAFLALSNHPGMTDTLALFCALNRPDLKIIALNRPFLLSLPNISKQLLYVTENQNERVSLVRRMSEHLRTGGAALTFPAGHTEPDPDVHDGALESLNTWTDSVGVFIRLAPETVIVPTLVRHVMWDKVAHHPILKTKHTKEDRELLAAALQLGIQLMFNLRPTTVSVQFGKPITAKELGSFDTQTIHQAVLAEMKQLIECPPEGEGVSAL